MQKKLNVRRLSLDVDKAISQPSILEVSAAINGCSGVRAFNITVSSIDIETVGMDVTISGEYLNYEELVAAMEHTGAAVHSIDQIACGDEIIERTARAR